MRALTGIPARNHLFPPILAAVLGLLLSAVPLSAQAVAGRLTDADSGAPLAGSLVVLVDAQGTRVAAAFSGADGGFRLTAPAAGRFTVRTERIGYAPVQSAVLALEAGATAEVRLQARPRPLMLEGIVAEAGRARCRVRPDDGAVAQLWDEARKALDAAAWTESARAVRFTSVTAERDLHPDSVIRSVESRTHAGTSGSPYISEPADSLALHGYLRRRDGTAYFLAPDAEALLSDHFQNTHCFRVVQGGREGEVGLRFEPTRGRRVVDVAGTLWLDAATGELRSLDFQYVNVPRDVTEDAHGRIEFDRLASGPWFVRRWYIRVPQLAVQAIGERRSVMRTGWLETGGDVRDVVDPAGSTRNGARAGATLAGVVTDGDRGGPLRSAVVFLSGTSHRAVADENGRFRMEGLPDGRYTVGVLHPRLELLGAVAPPTPVQLASGAEAAVELRAPAGPVRVRDLCDGQEGAALLVRVRDPEGSPAGAVGVSVRWTEVRAFGAGFEQARPSVQGVTDERGVFRACGVRPGQRLLVNASTGGRRATSVLPVGVAEGSYMELEIRLPGA